MDILFICGSAEHGKDGVGDFTRRLCGQVIRHGHNAKIVSLCDHQAHCFTNEIQTVEETSIEVFRIPISFKNNQRIMSIQTIVNGIQPDFISLQFVPYSFNQKGLPFWLPSFLKSIDGNHKWHVMFHELWLGIDKESSYKHKFIGRFQQLIIKKIITKTKVKVINTQNKLYQFYLQSINVNAEVMPIFGNIPLTAVKKEANLFTQFVLFGTIHDGAPFEDFISDLKHISNTIKKPLKFVFIGNNGFELNSYVRILENYNFSYKIIGIQPEYVISQILLNSDFGISTTPYFQTEKSGVYAAYKEHHLNTISVSRNWTPTKGQYEVSQIIKYEKSNLNLITTNIKEFKVSAVSEQFINSISIL
ncbi:hypothetical protein SAMN05444372_105249 [Flavobacterium micromati]|uniref:Uncharacterized protein n=1 Tax=Flavobacterium micromati TaxID=229205 RepID=A0A1M5JL69_9FLAO|nr:hypothetical protein [Flavobacterium micromati]SHG41312.1 hypothetical protein SAMN05444372_105249 [Flavobacterium micromati]